MGVKFNESPEDAECISCLKCMDKACKFDAITLEIAGIPVSGRGRVHRIDATKESEAAM